MATHPKSLYSASTDLCADVVASHPSEGGLFAMGTYEVTQSSAGAEAEDASPAYTRRGRVTLHQLEGHDEALQCHTLDSYDCAAVLDLSWYTTSSSSTLIAALANGHLSTHTLSPSSSSSTNTTSRLSAQPRQLRINAREALCLSVDVAKHDGRTIVSQSDGTLAFLADLLGEAASSSSSSASPPSSNLQAEEDDDDTSSEDALLAHRLLNPPPTPPTPRGLETWRAHDYEIWTAAFSHRTPHVAWSGSDDLTLKGWDLRTSNASSGRSPTFTTKRGFEGGVTALEASQLRPFQWAVGSYDAAVRIFDERNTARPVMKVDVGGGVWRVKWHPVKREELLVGAMHDGFKVLHVDAEGVEEESSIVKRFEEHESLAYGCDWDREPEREEGKGSRVISCSFYDRKLHVWRG